MGETVEGIRNAVCDLRRAHSESPSAMTQAQVVAALAEFARRWRDPSYPFRREAERVTDPFPFAMVRVSLDALLDSLEPEAVWRLIDSEGVRDAWGRPVIGHIVAANTPLLAWVSVIRALLVRSASLVKLPSGPTGEWGRLFVRSLADVSPALADCVRLAQWPGGTADLDAALCRSVDLVLAYGGDEAIDALKLLTPPGTPFLGYGHRVSFGPVPAGQGTLEAAAGFARDVLLYDQGGCLSPQMIFAEGDWESALLFAERLADALRAAVPEFPLPVRSPRAARTVREARDLARMEERTYLWEDPEGRWTVIARPHSRFVPSPTFGVVSVQLLPSLADLPDALAPVAHVLQGCAVAGELSGPLPGVSYVCPPGQLQAPPLGWRQDGRDVLRCLIQPPIDT